MIDSQERENNISDETTRQAQTQLADRAAKLARYRAALDAGADPADQAEVDRPPTT